MLSNLQILLVALASVVFLTVLYFFFKPVFTRSLIQNSLDDSKSLLFESELEQGTLGFNDEDAPQQEQELIILNLVSMDKSNFDINQVHTLLKNLVLSSTTMKPGKSTSGPVSYTHLTLPTKRIV